MKVLLAAINAKYIHSNLAVFSLKNYAAGAGADIEIAEYTINDRVDAILADIYKRTPDFIGFSCYIWNISYVSQLVTEIKKVLPKARLWLGGPEVSYNAPAVLKEHPEADGVMCGEGEETFLELIEHYMGHGRPLEEIRGITFREGGKITQNLPRTAMDLDDAPFVYGDMAPFADKIIYYESCRGCPFSCSYCLSSADRNLRLRSMDLVKEELSKLIEMKAAQVKFVDRTFNCIRPRAYEIWKFIKEHDNKVTNFHFEISADLLTEQDLKLMSDMRRGLIQLEIGVQSTNPGTIREIKRTADFALISKNVDRIRSFGNIHQHLDLIAGLPLEDIESFRKSFDDVYALKPEQLQLGFLKVLKGTYMHAHAGDYGLIYQDRPPFEVLSTKWLSYGDLLRLKGVEEMLEVYYNSGQFANTAAALEKYFPDAFSMYDALSGYYEENGLYKVQHSRIRRYEILFDFIKKHIPQEEKKFRTLLTVDLYLRDNVKNRPDFAGEETVTKEEARRIYDEEAKTHRYLPDRAGCGRQQLAGMTHLEKADGRILLFDYKNRDILTRGAALIVVDLP